MASKIQPAFDFIAGQIRILFSGAVENALSGLRMIKCKLIAGRRGASEKLVCDH